MNTASILQRDIEAGAVCIPSRRVSRTCAAGALVAAEYDAWLDLRGRAHAMARV